MKLTLLPLNEPIKCPECRGTGEVDSPEVKAAEYWIGVNSQSYSSALRLARRHGNLTVPCPCCKGGKTIMFTTISERLQTILDGVATGKMVTVKQAPTSLAGEDWWYILAHPQIIRHKLGYSSDYWLYHTQSEAARRSRSFW